MKIYVFARAYAPCDEHLDITDVEVFTSLDEAKKHLAEMRDKHVNDPEDGNKWSMTYDSDTYCHLIYDHDREEVIMTIEAREL